MISVRHLDGLYRRERLAATVKHEPACGKDEVDADT